VSWTIHYVAPAVKEIRNLDPPSATAATSTIACASG
jgi:hypothetical protein